MPRYFALVGADTEVKQVVVAEQDFIDANPAPGFIVNGAPAGAGAIWVETFMNGSGTERYAGIGQEYHQDLGKFITKKPYNSWVRDDAKAEWKAPKERPNHDKEYQKWNESTQDWETDNDLKDRGKK